MKKGVCVSAMFVVLVVAAAMVQSTAAVDCEPTALLPCLGAISTGQNPSAGCCSELTEQQPCFCGYIQTPLYKSYVDSPNARKVAAYCNVTIPTTC